MTSEPDRYERVCAQESGHALIALLEDLPTESVRASSQHGHVKPITMEQAIKEQGRSVVRVAHTGMLAEYIPFGGRRKDPDEMDAGLACTGAQPLTEPGLVNANYQWMQKEGDDVERILRKNKVTQRADGDPEEG